VEDDFVVVDDLNALDAGAEGRRDAVQRVLLADVPMAVHDVLGSELAMATVELHALAKLEAVRLRIGLDAPLRRKLRNEPARLGINADQVLVHGPQLEDLRRTEVATRRIALTRRRRNGDYQPVRLRFAGRGGRRLSLRGWRRRGLSGGWLARWRRRLRCRHSRSSSRRSWHGSRSTGRRQQAESNKQR
jgi:hypothetical protein